MLSGIPTYALLGLVAHETTHPTRASGLGAFDRFGVTGAPPPLGATFMGSASGLLTPAPAGEPVSNPHGKAIEAPRRSHK